MRAGRLDRNLVIQRKSINLSDSGEPVETWTTISIRPCSISPLDGDERYAGEQFVSREQVEFRIRWSSVVSDLSPLDRVVYPATVLANSPSDVVEGQLYDIMAVHELGRREGLSVKAARRTDVLRVNQLSALDLWTPLDDAGLVDWFDARDLQDGSVSSWSSRTVSGPVTESTNFPVCSSSVVTFDGVNDKVSRVGSGYQLISTQNLPDASGTSSGNGFTCTGLTRAPDGTWWVGNAGDNLTELCSLVHLSSDFSTKIGEILIAPVVSGVNSLQGVVYDTSDDTIWFVDLTNKFIRHITPEGILITADQIGPLAYSCNGVAYDPVTDRLMVSQESSGVINIYDAGAGSTVTVDSFDVGSGFDHLHYDSSSSILYATGGGNGSAGFIYAMRIGDDFREAVTDVAEADAIEGLYVDGTTLYVMSDGFFHSTPTGLNRVVTCRVPQLAGERFAQWAVFSVLSISGTKCVVCNGDAINHRGFGIYPTSISGMNTFANAAEGTSKRALLVSTGLPLMSSVRIYYAEVDPVNQTLKLFVNGSEVNSMDSSVNAVSRWLLGRSIRIGGGLDGSRFLNMRLQAVGQGFDLDRVKTEGYLADAFGLQSSLPSDHPYKTQAPLS